MKILYFEHEFNFDLSSIRRFDILQVISNGPSSIVNKRDIDPSQPAIFMNFGFNHPSFSSCTLPYLVIVDKKLATGEWSQEMITMALSKNPNTQVFLGGKLLGSKKLRVLAKKNSSVYFFFNDLTSLNSSERIKPLGAITIGGGATEASIVLAAQLGAKKINLFGFDGNNVLLGMLGKNTHFYGSDPMKQWDSPSFCARELRFLSYFLEKNISLAATLRKSGIRLYNYSENSIMKMYEKPNDTI